MNYDIDYRLVNSVADADENSIFYGSAVQEIAQEILSLRSERSWCNDEGQVSCLNDRISYEYRQFLNLLPKK